MEKLAQHLREEQKVLHTELCELGVQNLETPEDWIATPEPIDTEADENLIADRTEEWMERTAEVAELETRYNNIVRALTKIKEGTYGRCEICGAEIELKRLEANPAARTCLTHLNEESQLSL